MKNRKTLILIDGHALAFRQYYALERSNMGTSNGTPTWAVYGFFKAIFDLLKNKNFKSDAIAVAFDVSHKTFRFEKYKEYKANRATMPDALQSQMGLIMEGLKAFNIPVYTKEGFEADDLIGTISDRACELGHNVLILTGDQDSFQLIDKNGCVKVIIPSKGELITYDWNKVYEKLGVYPNQVIDYKALRGDVSDNIPGVFGIGEKSAVALLAEFGTVDNVLASVAKISKPAVRKRIEEGTESAKLSKFLATIIRDVDIDFDFDKACIELPDIAQVTKFFKDLQFYSLLKNINSIMSVFNNGIPCTKETILKNVKNSSEHLQLSIFANLNNTVADDLNYEVEVIKSINKLREAIAQISCQTLISFYTEAEVKDIVNSTFVGIAIAFNEEFQCIDDKFVYSDTEVAKTKIYYIPVGHSNVDDQLLLSEVLPHLKVIFENPNIKKVSHNIKTQYGILRDNGILTEGFVFDTQLASYEKNPTRNHELNVQSLEHLEHSPADYMPLAVGMKEKISFKDAEFNAAVNYITDITDIILRLTKFWLKELSQSEMCVMREIDIPVTLVLADMEFNGITVDINYLNKYSEHVRRLIYRIEKKVYQIANEVFNLNSPKQVAEVLYEKLKITKKKKKSTNAEVLEELAKEHEICRLILEYRKYTKLKNGYIDVFPQLIDANDKRIHTTYNMTNTATGRISSSNPNLQNVPVITEAVNSVRNAIVPADRQNYKILSADYSQIELRILAHVSGDENLIDAFNRGIDIHASTASKVFDVDIKDVTKVMRSKAKAVNFGIIYGQTKYGLAKSLGISIAEADNFIDKYFLTYPKVKEYMNNTVAIVEQNGFLETMFGRKRYFLTELESPISAVREFARRAAINFPIQGAGADLIKKAMIECHQNMLAANLKSKMIMQVHDEIVIETLDSELAVVKSIVKAAMELGQPFNVPLVVDISVGETWGK